MCLGFSSAPGMNRTCDLRFRKPLLYPLSYGSGDGAKCGAKFAATPHVIYVEVTGVCSEREEHPQKVYVSKSIFLVFLPPKAARTQIDE